MTDTPKPITTLVAKMQGINDRDGGYAADKTLRDYFAAHAPSIDGMSWLGLSEMLDINPPNFGIESESVAWWIKAEAMYRYRFADAMLAAREAR
jgi:hypothetical protein